MKTELRFEKRKMKAVDKGKECSVPDLLGEKILQNELEFRLDEEDEIYEGYGRVPNAYPYRQYNCYTRQLEEKEIKTAILENQYLTAVFLPDYGGRLWELWDKRNGRNLLYTNDVLQFSNLSVRNAWFSGGVEWNVGIIGHSPFTTEPLYVAKTEDEEGNPILRMYEYERIREVVYQMDFWIKEDDTCLNCRMRLVNESQDVIPMYWWSNIAVPEYEKGRIIVPAQKAFTYADEAVFKVDIPMVQNVDVTEYKNIVKSVDYFFDIPEDSPKYIANVDESGYGLFQLSTKRLRSRKLFSWGSQEASDHWQEFLTDKGGRYIEIQAGLGKTQYGCLPMAPHTAWEWMEQYEAVQIPKEMLHLTNRERADFLTGKVKDEKRWENLEKQLVNTKKTSKKKAEIIYSGSGYGALGKRGKLTDHLEFRMEKDSLKNWQTFFKTHHLHCPNPAEEPDEFMITDKNMDRLKKYLEENNQDNWYAHYHLGLGYIAKEQYQEAERELQKSNELRENPWALHGLGCTLLVLDKKREAAAYIAKGIRFQNKNISYLKEGFKLLLMCEAYEELCELYEKLENTEQNIPKVKFLYISALHKRGLDREAYTLLEEEGGLIMEDIREGEDSIANLWQELYKNLYGKSKEVPYVYNFKAF